MDKFYKTLFVVVVLSTFLVVLFTFNKTVMKSDFVMIKDEEVPEDVVTESEIKIEDATTTPSSEEVKSLDLK